MTPEFVQLLVLYGIVHHTFYPMKLWTLEYVTHNFFVPKNGKSTKRFFFFNFRESEKELRDQYEKQSGQLNHLTAEIDTAKMEISRQKDVIIRQQREMEDLRVKLANSMEQIEVRHKSREPSFQVKYFF